MRTSIAKRSRDPEKTRAHILAVAGNAIYQSGFQGVSIDQIVEQTDVTKGAFFHYFATKSEVGYAIVDEYLRDAVLDRWVRPLAAYRNPLQGILKLFKRTIETWPDENLGRGCPLNNLAQEMSSVDPVFSQKIQSVMKQWIEQTQHYLQKAQRDGYLEKTANTRELAEFVVTMQESIFAMGKTMNDRKIMQSLYQSIRRHLAQMAGMKR